VFPELLLTLIAAFAGFTQGMTGVGVITVALPLMALLVEVKTVIPMVGLLAVTINLALGWQMRGAIRWRLCLPLLLAAGPGIVLGVYVLKTVSSAVLQAGLGGVLLAYGGYAVGRAPVQRNLSHYWSYVAGFVAGGLGGSIGASGPPIIVYTTLQPWSKDTIKATMVGYFLLTTLGISSMHAGTGLVTDRVLGLYAASLPGLALGGALGMACYRHIRTEGYRRIMMWMILVLGGILTWKGLA
jgi:hypothetical protein